MGRRKTAYIKALSSLIRATPIGTSMWKTGSKNQISSLKQLSVENKVAPVYASPDDGEQCLVYLLDFFIKKLTPIAFEKDILYWQTKNQVPDDPAAS